MADKSLNLSEKNTKAEILEAYQIILEQVNLPQEETPKQKEDKKVLEKAKQETPDKIIQELTQLKLSVNQTINNLAEKLTSESEKLDTLQKAIASSEQELENTQKVKVGSENIYKLIELHSKKSQEFDQEISVKKLVWQDEQKEYEERVKKERTREQSEYDYQKQQTRKQEQDKYEEEKRLREREKEEYQSNLKELQTLRSQIVEVPKQTESAVSEAVVKSSSELQKEFQHKEALAKQQYDSDKNMAQLKIDTLESQLASYKTEIEELKKRLDEATHHVKDIAVAVVENKKESINRQVISESVK